MKVKVTDILVDGNDMEMPMIVFMDVPDECRDDEEVFDCISAHFECDFGVVLEDCEWEEV